MLTLLPIKNYLKRLAFCIAVFPVFAAGLAAQTNCGNLSTQVFVTHNTVVYGLDGAYTVQLSGEPGTYSISAENGQTCVADEFLCDLLGGSYCDPVPCTDLFSVDLADAAATASVTLENLPAGNYAFTVSNSVTGCNLSQTVQINGPPCNLTLGAIPTNVSTPGANDGVITVSAADATGDTWIKLYTFGPFGSPGELIDSVLNNGVFSGLATGNYILVATDEVLCSRTEQVEIAGAYCDLEIHAESFAPPSLFGLPDGLITMTGTSSFGNIQISRNEFFLSPEFFPAPHTFEGLSGGVFAFVATDDAGCEAVDSVFLLSPPCALVIQTTTQDATGGNDGSINVEISNGVPLYSVILYDENNTQLDSVVTAGNIALGNLSPANYSIKVAQIFEESFLGSVVVYSYCETTIYFTINGPAVNCDNFTGAAMPTDVTTYGGQDGTITVSSTGGTGEVTIVLNGDCQGDIFLRNAVETTPAGPPAATKINLPPNNPYDENTPNSLTSSETGDILIGSGVFTGLAAGDYHVCFFDEADCERVEYVTVGSALCEIVTDITSLQPSPNNNDGSIFVTASIAGSPEDARIFIVRNNYGVVSDGFNTVSAFNLPEDTYYINVYGQDATYCYRSDTILLNDGLNCDVAIEVTEVTQVTAYGAGDGTISVSSSSSFGDVTLSLAGQTLTNAGTFSGLGPGSYNVFATDEAGCTTQSPVYFITSPQCDLSLDISVDLPDPGQSNGGITIQAVGVSEEVYISVSIPSIFGFITIAGGVNHLEVVNLESFYYNITAYTDDYLYCNEGAAIFLPEAPCVLNGFATAFDATGPFNNDGGVVVGANGGTGLYTFSGPGVQTAYNTFSGLGPGTYTYNMSDITGCTASVEVTIGSPGCFELGIFPQNVSSYGGSDGSATGYFTNGASTGNVTYTLYKNGTLLATLVNNPYFPGLEAGNYQLFGVDDAGCNSSVTFTILQPECLLEITTNMTPVSVHGGHDGMITAAASGGLGNISISLVSQFLNEPLDAQNSPAVFTNLEAGPYLVIVADEVSCMDTVVVQVTEPACAITTNTSVQNVSVHGDNDGRISVTAGNGISPYSFELRQGGLTLDTEQSPASTVFGNLQAGTYTIGIIDQAGCVADVLAVVTEPDCAVQISVSATPVSQQGQHNGIVSASATGGLELYSFQLTLNGSIVAGQTGTEGGLVVFNNLAGGTYSVSITDQGNCSATGIAVVTEPSCAVNLTVSSSNVTIHGGTDGSIGAAASGGTGPYTYQLQSGGSTVQTLINDGPVVFNGLPAGFYTVVATDQANCSDTESRQITEPACSVVNTLTFSNVTTSGGSDGTIAVTTSGGLAPYTITLLPAGNTLTNSGTFTGLSAGGYTVSTVDAAGCADIDAITLTEPVGGCGAPVGVFFTEITSDRVIANWLPAPGANKYRMQYRPVGTAVWITANVNAPKTDKALNDLTPGAQYEFQIRTQCSGGTLSPWSPSYFFTTADPCSPPDERIEENLSPTKVTLKWETVSGAAKYRLRVRPEGGVWKNYSIQAPDTMRLVKNLIPGQTYEWLVHSICDPGGHEVSEPSESRFFTTPSAGGSAKQIDPESEFQGLEDDTVEAYPNPSSGLFKVDISTLQDGPVTWEIFNLDGKVIASDTLQIDGGFSQTRIDLTGKTPGLYLLRMRFAEGVKTLRLVVN